jgi:hypothetical protein
MKKRLLWLMLGLLPLGLHAQVPHQRPAAGRARVASRPRLLLPVAVTTSRVTYRDTARAAGIAPERLLHATDDVFAKNFTYFDYPLTPADTLGLPKPSEAAAPGEVVRIGSTIIFNPEAPAPVYVAGVSPPLNPHATYPSYPFVSFTLRLQAKVGQCVITITDIQQRSVPVDYQMKRQLAFYEAMRKGGTPKPIAPPAGKPIEQLYANWLPTAKPLPTTKAGQPHPSEAEARRLDQTMRSVLAYLRQEIMALAKPTR